VALPAYRIAFAPRAGQKVLTLQGSMPRDADLKQTLCAVEADDVAPVCGGTAPLWCHHQALRRSTIGKMLVNPESPPNLAGAQAGICFHFGSAVRDTSPL